jgi:hypothetical protein
MSCFYNNPSGNPEQQGHVMGLATFISEGGNLAISEMLLSFLSHV